MAEKNVNEEHVRNWKNLMRFFKTATESDLWKAYEYELKHKKRISFSMRIYGKASEMRALREKRDMVLALSK